MLLMSKANNWNNFLLHYANKFELNFREQEVFKLRFAHNSKYFKDKDISETLERRLHISEDTYITIKREIYRKFTRLVDGYPELENYQHKFKPLLSWLEEQYCGWLNSYSSDSNKFDNSHYIERDVDSICYRELLLEKSFIRIKAPAKMGKTSLLKQVLSELNHKGYRTLRFDFGMEELEMFSDYSKFCLSFCAGVSELLDLNDRLSESWSDRLGINQNVNKYFTKYLLPQIDRPFILGLDGLDYVFKYEHIATNFCKLLRGWHDNRRRVWQKTGIAIVHSTDVYSALDINSSPLAGIGKVIMLSGFKLEQIKSLAEQYQLDLTSDLVVELFKLTGGHPYLITIALKHLANPDRATDLPGLLQLAPTAASPYANHLRKLLKTLSQNIELGTAFARLVSASESMCLTTEIGFKLHSLGLVNIRGDRFFPKCDLYRQYFLAHIDEIR